MKLNLPLCAAMLMTCGLSALPVSAQDAPPQEPPPGAPGAPAIPGHRLDFLAPAEKEQFQKDMQQVLASNPTLKAQGEALKAQGEALRGTSPTSEATKSFLDDRKAFDDAMAQAILQLDPAAKPILDKIAAHRAEMRAKPERRQPKLVVPAEPVQAQ